MSIVTFNYGKQSDVAISIPMTDAMLGHMKRVKLKEIDEYVLSIGEFTSATHNTEALEVRWQGVGDFGCMIALLHDGHPCHYSEQSSYTSIAGMLKDPITRREGNMALFHRLLAGGCYAPLELNRALGRAARGRLSDATRLLLQYGAKLEAEERNIADRIFVETVSRQMDLDTVTAAPEAPVAAIRKRL